MLEDVRYNQNTNISKDDARVKSSDLSSKKNVSFRAGNPNAVDTTPTQDTYSQQPQVPPQQEAEMGMGAKYLKYGVPAGAALYIGSELFNNANRGEYEKSLVGRLGNLGDKLSNTWVVKNPVVEKVRSGGSSLKTKFKKFVLNHSTLRSMAETPTKPESKLVVNFLETQAEDDLKKGIDGLKKSFLDKNPKTLKLAGATADEIEALKAKYGVGAFGRVRHESAAVEEFLINKLGAEAGHPNLLRTIENSEQNLRNLIETKRQLLATQGNNPQTQATLSHEIEVLENKLVNRRAKVLNRLKHKHIGLTSKEINAIEKDAVANAGKLEQALEKAKTYSPRLSEHLNKIKSINTPKTKLGRLLPKLAKLGMRGLTFGGGFFNCLLMLGFFMSEPVKSTIDAPNDKKVSTAVHGFFDAMSWVIAMPIALKAMHAVNGLKNLGKTKAQVNEYNTKRTEFNKKVDAGLLTDKAAYDSEKAVIDNLKKAGEKPKGLKKVMSKIAKFLSIGLEQQSSYKEATVGLGSWGSNFKNWIKPDNMAKVFRNMGRSLPNFARNCVGYPLRFALYMVAFQPIVDKIFSAPLTALFGKPFDPEKAKEEKEKAQQEAELEAMKRQWIYPGPSIVPNPNAVNGLDKLDVDNLNDDNLVKQELIKQGKAKPKSRTINNNQQNGYPNSVNGVQIDIKEGKPFMPNGVNGAGGNNSGVNTNEKDPNKSEYDTVPRSYNPQIDKNNPIPYHDPYETPGYEHNYENMQKSLEKSNKFITETEKWIADGFPDD